MLQKAKWWIKMLWLDERGEDDPNADPTIDPNAGGDPNADPSNGQGSVDPNAGGQIPEPDPIITEFGEIPQDPKQFQEYLKTNVYSKYSKVKGDFDNLRNKAGLTERNLSSLRKTLKGSGINVVQDETGQIRLEVINQKPPERTRKFSDTHLQKLASHFQNDTKAAQEFLDVILDAAEDRNEDWWGNKETAYRENAQKTQVNNQLFQESTDLMFSHFPQLNGNWGKDGKASNPDFDQAFHDKVFDLWKTDYHNDPRGQLLATLRVAKEMKILPQAIKKAEVAGYEKGKTDKKILGPVNTNSSGKSTSGKKLSFEEYSKLSPEEQYNYNKQSKGIT